MFAVVFDWEFAISNSIHAESGGLGFRVLDHNRMYHLMQNALLAWLINHVVGSDLICIPFVPMH
jgi:hypothetical protein